MPAHDSPQQPGHPDPGAAPGDTGAHFGHSSGARGASGDGTRAEVSRHLDAIFAAVQREADEVREQARREAELWRAQARGEADRALADAQARAVELLDQRRARIAALSDELLHKAEAINARLGDADPSRRGFEHLIRALADTAERVAQVGAGPLGEPGSGPLGRPGDGAAAPAAAAPAAAAYDPDRGPRIVAAEMAGAGASRASVRAYLTGALGIREPEPFLDEAFGRVAS